MLKCAAIFTDNMVLLRDKRVCIWGECDDEKTVTVEIDGICALTHSAGGMWKVYLPAHYAGGPYELRVSCGDEKICFSNVMYGEVLLAAGQSNMELPLSDCETGKEALETEDFPDIRFYNTYKTGFIDEAADKLIRMQRWTACTDCAHGDMSAIAYYTARSLHETLKVPIGIVDCYQGGTSIVSWLGEDILSEYSFGIRSLSEYKALVGDKTDEQYELEVCKYWEEWHAWDDKVKMYKAENQEADWEEISAYAGECPWPQPIGRKSVFRPGGGYDAMIKQVAPYTVAGVLYYQGETDTQDADEYYPLMDRLIQDWRRLFENRELFFVITQLPMYIEKNAEDDYTWAKMREKQLAIYENVKNTALLVLGDCGEYGNIHPTDKKTPGLRLGRLLLDCLYHKTVNGAPMLPERIYRDKNRIIIKCRNTYGCIIVEQSEKAIPDKAFEIAGADGIYRECSFYADGDLIILYGDGIENATQVRYAWFNYGEIRIFNASHIPLAPFGPRSIC